MHCNLHSNLKEAWMNSAIKSLQQNRVYICIHGPTLYLQYGEAKLSPFINVKWFNFASPYWTNYKANFMAIFQKENPFLNIWTGEVNMQKIIDIFIYSS